MEADKLIKNAVIKANSPDEGDIAKINEYTLEPLTAEQVYTFKAVIGNNETDDRNLMPFSRKALEELAPLYIGKTMIKDHDPSADNQVARVYDTEIRSDPEKTTGLGEPYAELIAKCYMAKTPENEGLISEIKAGIKREVSTGFAASSLRCSICGTDWVKSACAHRLGGEYEGKTCMRVIDGCSDAYELSFVAVPAQPNAGTVKAAEEEPEEAPEKTEEEKALAEFAAKKAEIEKRLAESREKFVF